MAGLANAPVNKAILGITVAVFAVGLVSQDARIWLFDNLSSWNFALANGEWWRLVSAALVHSYNLIIHIGFNMYFLYMLGPSLERQVGSAPFAALYLATAATGGLAGYYLGGIGDASIGASGAIFGIVAVWMYAAYKSGHRGARMMANRQMLYLVGVGIVLPFFASGLNISWQGHLGGLLGGLAIGWAWGLAAPQSSNPKLTRTVLASAVLVTAIAVVMVIPAGWA